MDKWRQEAVRASYYFPLVARSKQRAGGSSRRFTKPETRQFERDIQEIAIEQAQTRLDHGRLGARITINTSKQNDIDNVLKALFDGLNRIAYLDDAMFDYVEMVRHWVPKGQENIEIELLSREEKC